MNFSAFDILERGDTVVRTVDRKVCIIRNLFHRFKYAARSREKSRAALFRFVHIGLKLDARGSHPLGKLLKGKHRVGITVVIIRFVFFCNARTYKHDFRLGNAPFDILRVRLHGRENVGKVFQFVRKILLNEKIDGMTTRGNHDVAFFLFEHFFIFGFNDRRADRRLFDFRKTELLQSGTHSVYPYPVVIGDKRRRKADVNGRAARNKNFSLLNFALDFLGILRADYEAVSAKNTFVADYMRLICRKSYRFYGAEANTLIAVFTVRFF